MKENSGQRMANRVYVTMVKILSSGLEFRGESVMMEYLRKMSIAFTDSPAKGIEAVSSFCGSRNLTEAESPVAHFGKTYCLRGCAIRRRKKDT